MQQQNSAFAELIYKNAWQACSDAGLDMKRVILTPSHLKLETQLIVNKTSFDFPLLTNQPNSAGAVFPTERRLTNNDSFICSSLGVFISKPASNVDSTASLHTYPNPLVFSTAGVAAALETLYNSELSLSVDSAIVLPAWDLLRHRKVPNAQFSAGGLLDQFDGGEDGFFPIAPTINFVGKKTSTLTLKLPAALAAVEPFQRITFFFRGMLVQVPMS